MGEMRVFELPLEAWVSGFVLISIILFILYAAALFRIGRLRKRLNSFLNNSDVPGLEAVISKLHEKIDRMESISAKNEQAVGQLQQKTANMKGHVAVLRYNAFAERGSDLSFSVALLDYNNSGVIITGIYGRNDSTTYAKPIDKGISRYDLSEEESLVLKDAMSK